MAKYLDLTGLTTFWNKLKATFSLTSHTHKVKINGSEKTIAATGGSAVDLGTYLTSHQDISGKADKKNFYAALVSTSDSKAKWVKIDWGTSRAGRAVIAVVYGCENGSSSGAYQVSLFKAVNANITSAVRFNIINLVSTDQVPRVRYDGTAVYLGLYSSGNWTWNVAIQVSSDNAPTISQVDDSSVPSATVKSPDSYPVTSAASTSRYSNFDRALSYKVNGYVDGAQSALNIRVGETGSDSETIYFS